MSVLAVTASIPVLTTQKGVAVVSAITNSGISGIKHSAFMTTIGPIMTVDMGKRTGIPMIDFNEMVKSQQEGLREIDSLDETEKEVLKHFCSLATEALLNTAHKREAPFEEVVINVFRTGIGLGLRLSVVKGEVRGRE